MDDRLVCLIAEAAKIEPAAVNAEMNLRTDLGLDSLTLVALLMRCGEELGIDPDELIERVPVHEIRTVADLIGMGARL
jgi:acyl carrier protein